MIDKHGRTAIIIVGAIVLLAALVSGCAALNERAGLSNDNPIEQIAEQVIDAAIEHETGVDIDIDLTPELDDDDPAKVYPEADE